MFSITSWFTWFYKRYNTCFSLLLGVRMSPKTTCWNVMLCLLPLLFCHRSAPYFQIGLLTRCLPLAFLLLLYLCHGIVMIIFLVCLQMRPCLLLNIVFQFCLLWRVLLLNINIKISFLNLKRIQWHINLDYIGFEK